MPELRIYLSTTELAELREGWRTFVAMATRLDESYVPPSFDSYVRAKLTGNPSPLTDAAVADLMDSSPLAGAKGRLKGRFGEALQALLRHARDHGFGGTSTAPSKDTHLREARRLAECIVQTTGVADLLDAGLLAQAIDQASIDIRLLEADHQTPAWRLAESLRRRIDDTIGDTERTPGCGGRDKRLITELRVLMALAVEYGSMTGAEANLLLGDGSAHCLQTGHVGQTVLADVIEPDDVFLRLYREDMKSDAFLYWRTERGGVTIKEHALSKVIAGRVDPFEAERIVGQFDNTERPH